MSRQTHRTCIRMSEKEYQRLKHQSGAAGLSANAWLMKELARNRPILRKLILGERVRVRLSKFGLNPHPGVNHIYSNVRQIARNPRARELAPEAVRQLEFLADLLCGESDRLTQQV